MLRRLNTALVILVSLTAPGFAMPVQRPAICGAPIRLSIAVIDPGFGIEQAEIKSAIEQTGNLWSAAAHRPLFVYDPKGDVAVNLIYDERQQATQRYVAAHRRIQEITEKAASILAELKPLQKLLKEAEQSYSSELAAFDRLKEIQALGGAQAARERAVSLQKKKQQLDRMTAEINARIDQYDALVTASNAELKALTESGSAGIELISGHYAEEDGEKRIDIFQFKDRTDLLLVLAHELGHALGLGHNNNPRSIMAPLIATRDIALSPDDSAALNALSAGCK